MRSVDHFYAPWRCSRCDSCHFVSSSGQWVCKDCGLVDSVSYEGEILYSWQLKVKTYKRLFYFNERCSRWMCMEPSIDRSILDIILHAARRSGIEAYNKRSVSKILKSIRLTPKIQKKFRSKKFKKNLLTDKRFYDKYYEKWKTIVWKITGDVPNLPERELVDLMKKLFSACQIPFEKLRHSSDCDGRYNCSEYFDCLHNFINYDFIFRKLLQISELMFGYKGAYTRFKDEFGLVSENIRNNKLRPLFFKICYYHGWVKVSDE